MNVNISLSKRILKKIIKYLIIFILGCICIYYSSTLDVNAESQYVVGDEANVSMPSFARFYDILSSTSVTPYSTSTSLSYAYTASLPQTAGGTGSLITFTPSTPLASSTLYALTIYVGYNSGSIYPTISSLGRLAVGPSLGDSANAFASGGNCSIYYRANSTAVSSIYVADQYLSTGRVFYIFSCTSNGEAISVPYTASESGTRTNYFFGYDIEVLGSTSGLTSSDVQDVIDNSNLASASSIDEVQENITNVKEELTDTLDTSLNDCYSNLFNPNPVYQIGSGVYDYDISTLEVGKTYTISSNVNFNFKIGSAPSGYTDVEMTSGSTSYTFTYQKNSNNTGNRYLMLWTGSNSIGSLNATNYEFMLVEGSSTKSYAPYGEKVCSSKIDETNDKLDNLTGAITDSSAPDTSGLSDAAGWLPPGPVDSLVNLPINLLNSLLGNMGTTCTNINLTLPFINKDFTIPCPSNLLSNLGNTFLTFWEGFGLIAGCWCLYKYFIALYKWVESALTMDEKEQLGKWGGV